MGIAKKFTKSPYLRGLRSFKVINVDIPKKLIASDYYDKQHVCAYLQPFLRYRVFTRSSKRPALYLLEVCWTFAGSCKHPIRRTNNGRI